MFYYKKVLSIYLSMTLHIVLINNPSHANRTGSPQVLINGVPLTDEGAPAVTSSVEALEEALVTSLSRHTGRLQRAVFRGELSDGDDAVEHLMRQPHVMPRLEFHLFSSCLA